MNIIDRRHAADRHKSIGQKERFMRRVSEHVKRAVARNIRDLSVGGGKGTKDEIDVNIPKRDLSQPVFGHGDGGQREIVHPGNEKYYKGDKLPKPTKGGNGNGNGGTGGGGDGIDDFLFSLSVKTFFEEFFAGRKLPNRQKTDEPDTTEMRRKRDGFSNTGIIANIDIVRTARNAMARRIATHRPSAAALDEAKEALTVARQTPEAAREEKIGAAQAALDQIADKRARIPYIDPLDARYRHHSPQPSPNDRIVLFLLMDVSGSMTEHKKQVAKTFATFYARFVQHLHKGESPKNQNDKPVDIVFVRHTDTAEEVDEQKFFYDPKTGGTMAHTSYDKVKDIIAARYSNGRVNMYGAHLSDGDSGGSKDNEKTVGLLNELLPRFRHFAYLDVPDTPKEKDKGVVKDSPLWEALLPVAQKFKHFVMERALDDLGAISAFERIFPKDGQPAARPSAQPGAKAAFAMAYG